MSHNSQGISRQALSQFLKRSAVRNSGGAWIESCARQAESMWGLDRHKFADLLADAAHAHHQYGLLAEHDDENWADWYADHMLTHGNLLRPQTAEQPRTHHVQTATYALKLKHEELMEEVSAASRLDGPVGSAAREVEWVLRPHLREEEKFALPALEALRAIVRRAKPKELQAMVDMTDRLQGETSDIRAQHAVLVLALEGLTSAAQNAGDESCLKLARKLTDYAKMEETIIYPAIVLMGDMVKEQLAKEKTRRIWPPRIRKSP